MKTIKHIILLKKLVKENYINIYVDNATNKVDYSMLYHTGYTSIRKYLNTFIDVLNGISDQSRNAILKDLRL